MCALVGVGALALVMASGRVEGGGGAGGIGTRVGRVWVVAAILFGR